MKTGGIGGANTKTGLAFEGKTPLYFAEDKKLVGIIAVADVIKEDSQTAIKELQDMAQRFDVALKLSDGFNYNQVSKETGASSATISRVNKCLMYGNNGYKTVIERIKAEEK